MQIQGRHIILKTLLLFIFIVFFAVNTFSQSENSIISDSIANVDSIVDNFPDVFDSLNLPQTDSIPVKKVSKSAIEAKIDYKASDSLKFDFGKNKAYLFNNSNVIYQNINITSGIIEVDFDKQELKASPLFDTLGNTSQEPHYDDQNQQFDSKELTYNFQSKKARIKNIITKQEDMFIHGQIVKKMPDDVTYIKKAMFTNCDLEHPHYYIVATRAKVIPKNKIVTGGAMFFMNDVPTPLVLPFAMFPNVEKRKSGIIFPNYGESDRQGFFFRNGGFYWSINDYMDVKITGDIYTKGDWKANLAYQYRLRYKFSGSLGLEYGMIQSGDPVDINYAKNYTLKVTWTHRQDPKASKNSVFSASVNYFNSKSQQFSENFDDLFNNQSNSNIAYSYNNLFGLFNFTTSASLNLNVNTHNVAVNLPTIALTLKEPWYPLRRKNRKGSQKWWETLKFTYSLNGKNDIKTLDSMLLKTETFKNMSNGIRQNVSMSMDIKLFKYINWNFSGNYHEYWYFNKDERYLLPFQNVVQTERKNGFFTSRDFDFSSSMSTTLYGMLRIPKFFVRAIRHQMTPSVSFSIRPDFYTYQSGYRWYYDGNGNEIRYNVYEKSPNGMPSGMKSGNVGLSIANTLEAKITNKKDTITGERKIKILESFSLNTAYNIFADSLRWSPLNISLRTTLFKKIAVNFSTTYNFYAKDSLGRYYNKSAVVENKKLAWKDVENLTLSMSWRLGPNGKNGAPKQKDPAETPYYLQSPFSNNLQMLTDDIDFSIPWSITLNYSFQYRVVYDIRSLQIINYPPVSGNPAFTEILGKPYKTTITQTLNVSGDISITPKWKVAVTTGFDFTTFKLATTAFEIRRDLHCWSLNIRWVPFGPYKEWSFSIRANSGMLSDVLKYDKRRSYLENGYQ